MTLFPTVFVSHGSPDTAVQPSPAQSFLKQLGAELSRGTTLDHLFDKPKAILVISAHWATRVPTVSAVSQPKTIHDFSGFASELYALNYPAPGAPALADRVAELLSAADFEVKVDGDRGLDHGAWEPLMLMYPEADIPVTQLSLQPTLGTAYHLRLGRALASLRQEGVLILASGSTTHNIRAFRGQSLDTAPPDWVEQFDQWLAETVAQNDIEALLDYRQQAPYAAENHPSEEHFLPFFVALGAAEARPGKQLHSSFTYGVLSMAAYAFG
jgi:4,5-DOPA dioxygenase extradiol